MCFFVSVFLFLSRTYTWGSQLYLLVFLYNFLPPGPIDYAEHVIQGSQAGYAGWNNQHNIHLVFGAEVQTHNLLIMSRLP